MGYNVKQRVWIAVTSLIVTATLMLVLSPGTRDAVAQAPMRLFGTHPTTGVADPIQTDGNFALKVSSSVNQTGTSNDVDVASIAVGDTDIGNVDLEFAGVAASVNAGPPDATTQRVFLAQRATYTAATTAKTATAAGTGPFFTICGSATKTLRVLAVRVSGTVATAAVYGDVTLRKTSTATSLGTAVALTKVPLDSNSVAATASLTNFYSALATAGTLVGTVGAQGAVFPITATVAASMANLLFDWMNRQESEAVVLRGTTQCLEAGFGTTTTNAPTLQVEVTWTEE